MQFQEVDLQTLLVLRQGFHKTQVLACAMPEEVREVQEESDDGNEVQ